MGVAAGVRRIEALTGEGAYGSCPGRGTKNSEQIGQALKANPGEIFQKVDRLLQRQKELEREILSLQGKLGHQEVLDLLSRVKEVKGIKFLSAKVDGKDPKQMRDFVDQLKSKIGSGIVLLGRTEPEQGLPDHGRDPGSYETLQCQRADQEDLRPYRRNRRGSA